MNKVIGQLEESHAPGSGYVTWKDAKQQMRDAAKAAGIELGTFRSRSVSRKVLACPTKAGSATVTAERKPGADIQVVMNSSTSVDATTKPFTYLAADGTEMTVTNAGELMSFIEHETPSAIQNAIDNGASEDEARNTDDIVAHIIDQLDGCDLDLNEHSELIMNTVNAILLRNKEVTA